MQGVSALWTAAHHKIPLLTIMHNNRGYHAEVMFVQRMAALHQHEPLRTLIVIAGTRPVLLERHDREPAG